MTEKTDNTEFDINQLPEPADIGDIIMNLMVNPNLSPLNYFNDFTDGGSDIDNLKEGRYNESNFFDAGNGKQFMSMTTHAMHHHLERDPQKAAEILVARAARKMICYGARPLALTAMLYHINYADPNGNNIAQGIKKGLENASAVFGVQISDRKIRFDHFDEHGNNAPTLIVTLVGVLNDNTEKQLVCMDPGFKSKGHNIFMLGRVTNDISTSDYLEFYHGISDSPLPQFDLKLEAQIAGSIKELVQLSLIDSAAPVAKGGVFFTLLRAGWLKGLGFDITTAAETRVDSFLFGEAMGRVIVSVSPENEDAFIDYMYELKTPYFTLGHVTKGEVRIDDQSFGYIDKMSGSI
ncbi:MAG: AIR synthase related protein [Prolixibacteraceae bacterium]|jgi:phosphoribosylformylglycinamidine (FGAM) synthase-like enzyme|nr:AIR synthase related protein [Prolixibacteraceae bacterium]